MRRPLRAEYMAAFVPRRCCPALATSRRGRARLDGGIPVRQLFAQRKLGHHRVLNLGAGVPQKHHGHCPRRIGPSNNGAEHAADDWARFGG
jgi:hypothetical protein